MLSWNFFKSNKTICESPDLLELDRQVAAKYSELNTNSVLRDQKRTWKDKRNDCKGDYSCINDLYQERIQELDSELARERQEKIDQETLEEKIRVEAQNSIEINETAESENIEVIDAESNTEQIIIDSNNIKKKNESSLLADIFSILFLTSPIAIPILYIYFSTRCPRCWRCFVKREIDSRELDRYISSAPYTISRTKNHTSTGYRVVTVFVTEHFYKCKKCQYQWSVVKHNPR